MKIAAFTYNFPHQRTQMALCNLAFYGYKPEILLAQDKKKLTFYQSKIRFSPDNIDVPETSELAKFYDIDYFVGDHNAEETIAEVKKHDLDVGLILGARILSGKIINAFNIGVINPHPGIIPNNRGLDNLKWAIHDRIPQAVTTHLIEPRIDMGRYIDMQFVDVHPDDTLMDVHVRQYELMHKMLVEAIQKLEEGFEPIPFTDEGTYHEAMPPEIEANLMDEFESYKRDYPQIVEAWRMIN